MENTKKYSGAVIYRATGAVFLQLRDSICTISNPGKLTTFGGRALANEEPFSTLQRELHEELNLHIEEVDAALLGNFRKYEAGTTTDCSFYAVIDRYVQVHNSTEGVLLKFASTEAAANDERLSGPTRWALTKFRELLENGQIQQDLRR